MPSNEFHLNRIDVFSVSTDTNLTHVYAGLLPPSLVITAAIGNVLTND
jgi:hypothetical protein